MKRGGRASKHQIARELKISSDYAGLVLGELKRKEEVAFSGGLYVLTPGKRGVNPEKTEEIVTAPAEKRPARRSRRPKRTKKAPKESKLPTGQAKIQKVEKNQPQPLVAALGISKSLTRTLEKAGYATIESIAEAPINKLMADAKLKLSAAARLINQARKTK
ncbi:MAG: hypothetical protein UV01_C0003G0014 [Parcubacteria group bacterium GW2011_GWA2_42_14]|nr:MAG: hypothetical protein UV01_C0003G0014 [Parcubacteria group bacterium GW2011_GWA2_42_14]